MRYLWLLPLILAQGCGQALPEGGSCAQGLTGPSAKPGDVAGGVLQATADDRLGQSVSPGLSCSAVIATVGQARVLYTARHCVRLGSMKGYVFHRFVDGAYVPEPITLPMNDLAERIKSDPAITDMEVKSRMRTILDGGSDLGDFSDDASKRCQRQTKGTACLTALDLAAIRLDAGPLEEDLASVQVGALEAYGTHLQGKVISNLDKQLSRCARGAEVCPKIYTSQGQAAWKRYFGTEDWTKVLTSSTSKARARLREVWAKLDAGSGRLLVAGNGVQSGSLAFTVKPLEGEVDRFEDPRPQSRTYMVSNTTAFAKGDSGSLLLISGIPVAVLSHVDGEPSSGGASLVALPTRKASPTVTRNEPAQASPANPQEPSSQPVQAPATAPAGVESTSSDAAPPRSSDPQASTLRSCG